MVITFHIPIPTALVTEKFLVSSLLAVCSTPLAPTFPIISVPKKLLPFHKLEAPWKSPPATPEIAPEIAPVFKDSPKPLPAISELPVPEINPDTAPETVAPATEP